jgi:hypothetical protein
MRGRRPRRSIASCRSPTHGEPAAAAPLADLAERDATKRAVNRVADAAGFRTALYTGLDVVGPLYATATEHGMRFREIARTEGVPAAVKWRSAQFKA